MVALLLLDKSCLFQNNRATKTRHNFSRWRRPGNLKTKYVKKISTTFKHNNVHPACLYCRARDLILACVADETKPRYSPSTNQRPKACSAPRVLPGFSIIGSNWLMHLAVLSCTVIGRVDLVEPWLRSR